MVGGGATAGGGLSGGGFTVVVLAIWVCRCETSFHCSKSFSGSDSIFCVCVYLSIFREFFIKISIFFLF